MTLNMKKLFLVLVLCLCSLASWAQRNYDISDNSTGPTLYYKIDDPDVSVTHPSSDPAGPWSGYTLPMGSLTIPSIVHTRSVTSIGDSAFSGCFGLTSVVIPNSVTSIGKYVFYGCSSLTSVVIPNSVTTIGEKAFMFCSGLTSVIIPNSVTTIESDAFNGIDTVYYRGSATGSPWGADTVITTSYTEDGDPLVYESPYKTMVID